MKSSAFHVLTSSINVIRNLNHQALCEYKNDIREIYRPVKIGADTATIICSAYLFFVTLYPTDFLRNLAVYSYLNPILSACSILTVLTCLFIKIRITKLNKLTTYLIAEKCQQKAFFTQASNDNVWHDSISKSNIKESKIIGIKVA